MSLSSDLEVGWEEEFALGDHESRARSLLKLAPGSREWHFFNLLYKLQERQLKKDKTSEEEIEGLLTAFEKSFGAAGATLESMSAAELRLRVLLQAYDEADATAGEEADAAGNKKIFGQSKKGTLKKIAESLGITLGAVRRPEVPNPSIVEQKSPPAGRSEVPADLLDHDAWMARARSGGQNGVVTELGLLQNLKDIDLKAVQALSYQQRANFVASIAGSGLLNFPCPDKLVTVIADLLTTKPERRGESRRHASSSSSSEQQFTLAQCPSILARMTLEQLTRLQTSCKGTIDLRRESEFVEAYLTKLCPPALQPFGSPQLSRSDLEEFRGYLGALKSFLSECPQAKFLPIKFLVVYHLLRLHRRLGSNESEEATALFFQEWLKFPRALFQSGAQSLWKNKKKAGLASNSINRAPFAPPQQQQQQQRQLSNTDAIFGEVFDIAQDNRGSMHAQLQRALTDRAQRSYNYNNDDDDDDVAFSSDNDEDDYTDDSDEDEYNEQLSPRQLTSQSKFVPPLLSAVSGSADQELTAAYILDVYRTATVTHEQLEDHFDEKYLFDLRAQAKLLTCQGDAALWTEQLQSRNIRTLRDETTIEFAETNDTLYQPDDSVVLDVWLKNVDSLIVKVFEINTETWYRTQRKEIDTGISLDGLVSPDELRLDFSDRPPMQRFLQRLPLPSLDRCRGVFVVELIGNGKSSRALIRKGHLYYNERLTPAGHVFSVYDEQLRPVPSAQLLLLTGGSRLCTKTTAEGEILVPYASAEMVSKQFLIRHEGFCCLSTFVHRTEQYQLSAGMYVNRESLLPSNEATVLVRPVLYGGAGCLVCPLDRVAKASLLIRATDDDHIASTKELSIDRQALIADGTATVSFVVPPSLASLELTLSVSVRPLAHRRKSKASSSGSDSESGDESEDEEDNEEGKVSDDDEEEEDESTWIKLQDNMTVTVNQDRTQRAQDITAMYLMPLQNNDYCIATLGRSGEPIVGRALTVSIQHRWLTHAESFSLVTDANGCVVVRGLDPLYFRSIQVPDRGQYWNLEQQHRAFTWPSTLHLSCGDDTDERVSLPAPYGVAFLHVELPEVGVLVHDLSEAVLQLRGGAVEFDARRLLQSLPSPRYRRGDFLLSIAGAPWPIRLRLQTSGRLLSSTRERLAPAFIASVEANRVADDNDKREKGKGEAAVQLRIRVRNPTASTSVHVSTSTFAPGTSLYGLLSKPQAVQPSVTRLSPSYSMFLSGRELSDEIRYIMNRKYQAVFAGQPTSFGPPSLLVVPHTVRETSESQGVAAAGNQYDARAAGAAQSVAHASASVTSGASVSDPRCLDFLAQPPQTLFRLPPGLAGNGNEATDDGEADGGHSAEILVTVPVVAQYRSAWIEVVVTNGADTSSWSLATTTTQDGANHIRRHDLTQNAAQSLTMDRHFVEKCTVTVVPPDTTFQAAASSSGHNLEYFDSLTKAFSLLLALSDDRTQLKSFEFLLGWATLDAEQKARLYASHACHELNFFLYCKDGEFFRRVVRHHLQQRTRSSLRLIDRYLLDPTDQLRDFLRPDRLGRLNVFERLLLASRSDGLDVFVRNEQDHLALNKLDPRRERDLFNVALSIHRMDIARPETYPTLLQQQRLHTTASSSTFANSFLSSKPMQRNRQRTSSISMPRQLTRCASFDSASDDDQDLCYSARSSAEECEQDVFVEKRFAGKKKVASKVSTSFHRSQPVAKRHCTTAAKELAETFYYNCAESWSPQRVRSSRFWLDFAQHLARSASSASSSSSSTSSEAEGRSPTAGFLSTNLGLAGSTITEALLALAIIDLPFEDKQRRPAVDFHPNGGIRSLSNWAAMIVFQKVVAEAEAAAGSDGAGSRIFVTQQIYDPLDPTTTNEAGETVGKFVKPDELLPQYIYGIRTICLNMTEVTQEVDVLCQIPEGSIALTAKATVNNFVRLAPYSNHSLETLVYFPKQGTFSHFPAHLSKNERVLAYAAPARISVGQKTPVVERTWKLIASDPNNNDAELVEHLATANLQQTQLAWIEWRVQDNPTLFAQVTRVLRHRRFFSPVIWKYSLRHGTDPELSEYLYGAVATSSSLLRTVLQHVDSSLVTGDRTADRLATLFEYDRIINQRTHVFGARRKLLNDAFRTHYREFLAYLTRCPTITAENHLIAANFLLAMDRPAEALAHFNAAQGQLQDASGEAAAALFTNEPAFNVLYAWFRAYFALLTGDTAAAKAIAEPFAQSTEVQRFRSRFQTLVDEVAQLDVQRQSFTASSSSSSSSASADIIISSGESESNTAPSFVVDANANTITIKYGPHIDPDDITINYYSMDIELLFSTSPFAVDAGLSSSSTDQNFQYIKPTFSQRVSLPADATSHSLPIPGQFLGSNVMIELYCAGVSITQSFFSHSLGIRFDTALGRLTVWSKKTGAQLPGVYVKVYARQGVDAKGSFHKDGYTDFAGRFDYFSLNSARPNLEEFSVMLISPDHGAVIQRLGAGGSALVSVSQPTPQPLPTSFGRGKGGKGLGKGSIYKMK